MEPEMPLPVTFGLVGTSEPGNMGTAARSLAAFGFSRLMLIEPRRGPSSKDRSLAVKMGKEVLNNAETIRAEDVASRLADYDEVWGTSARLGRRRRSQSGRQAVGEYLAQEPKKLLILFGPERDGLSLDWLDRCHRLIHLPTREQHPLNLAQAVTVLAYELRAQQEQAAISGAQALSDSGLAAPGGGRPGEDPTGTGPAGAGPTGAEQRPGDALAVSLQDRQELLRRTERLLEVLGYPSRALLGHPPSAHLQPLRSGGYSQGQARWLLGLIRRLERRLDIDS